MQGSDDRSTPSLFNIFVKEFLTRLGERNEPASAAEADVAGPWQVEELRYTCYGRRGRHRRPGGDPQPQALVAGRGAPGGG